LSEKKVAVGDWVNAGQVIGLGGSTGRSTGPHLHYEVRYQGFSFDPEWIIDFKKGDLRQRLFILKKKYFGVNHADPQNFEDEMPEEKKEEGAAAKPAAKPTTKPSTATTSSGAVYHVIVSGDTLYALAVRNKTSVAAICRLNNITENTVLQLGQKIRIK
jgi:murein DD-endopeptidase MepM/ murein hydrolase activator NlpD